MSTVRAPVQAIAMSLLHGDHTADSRSEGRVVTVVLASQDVGTPRKIRMNGWACNSYSFRTVEFFGATASAEW